MKTLAQITLIAIGALIVGSASAEKASLTTPFWEKKPSVMRGVLENRKVAVAVDVSETENDQQQHMNLEGVGLIHAPEAFARRWILDFSNLKRVSSYVQEVRWNSKTKLLFLHTAAFGYHARMHIEMLPKEGEGQMEVTWVIKKGFLQGLKGQLKSQEKGFAKTLFSVQADDKFQKTRIPKIFVEFGFEVVVQKFAENVRSLIEEDFKKGR